MEASRAQFYIKAINVYKEKEVPQDKLEDLYNIIFIELSMTDSENISLEHVCLMEESQKHFVEIEDFKRANFMKESKESAFKIFEARQKVIDMHKKINDMSKDNENK
jgi:hypothetical protein